MKSFLFQRNKSCQERIVEVFAKKCKEENQNPLNCLTSISVVDIAQCNSKKFPDKKDVLDELWKEKELGGVNVTEHNFPNLTLYTTAYDRWKI